MHLHNGIARVWAILWIAVATASLAFTFNVDTAFPTFYESRTVKSPDDLFGYKVLLNSSTMYVGAPAEHETGAVYKCDLRPDKVQQSQNSCNQISVPNIKKSFSANRDFLGSSLALDGNLLYVCAPRSRAEVWSRMQNTTGDCYTYDSRINTAKHVYSLKNPDRLEYRFGDKVGWLYSTLMGEASIVSSQGDLVIGLPMARRTDFNWDQERITGSIMKLNTRTFNMKIPVYSNLPWGTFTKSTHDDPHTADFTASAIVRGRFYYEGDDHYVIGAPKANRLRGRVYLCPDCVTREQLSVIYEKKSRNVDGFQFGSRFGQTLCALDLNGDQYDDLVIGAPLESDRDKADIGQVYVYKTVVDDDTLLTDLRLMTGISPLRRAKVSGGRFGAALASLGDLDNDGFGDFAVAAPGEGQGAVYIYRGDRFFKFTEPQKLTPSSLGLADARYFGLSIAGNSDIDSNGYPDLAIGIQHPERVVVLRSLEVVRIHPIWRRPEIPRKAINPKVPSFEIAFVVSLYRPITRDLWLNVQFHGLDSRVKLPREFDDDRSRYRIGKGETRKEARVTISPAKPNFGVDLKNVLGVPQPLDFHVELNFSLSNTDCPKLGCPVMDPKIQVAKTFDFEVPLQTGCDDNNNCKCNLRVVKRSGFNAKPIEVIVGESKAVSTQLTVENSGSEPAYNTLLHIMSESPIEPPNLLDCTNATDEGGTEQSSLFVLTCKFPNLASKSERTVDLSFDFDSSSQDLELDHMTMTFSLESSCSLDTQDSDSDMVMTTDVSFKYITNLEFVPLEIEGQRQQQIKYNTTNLGFLQSFRIYNHGPSPVKEDFMYHLLVPKVSFLTLDTLSRRSSCTMSTSSMRVNSGMSGGGLASKLVSCATEKCHLYSCGVSKESLLRGMSLDVELRYIFDASVANEDKEHTRYLIRSLLKGGSINSNEYPFIGMTTEFYHINDATADQFNSMIGYIAGAIIAAVLLAVLGLILWKTKAFSKMRIFKKQLDEVDAEEKRQSRIQ